jgi:hypothetical protein
MDGFKALANEVKQTGHSGQAAFFLSKALA